VLQYVIAGLVLGAIYAMSASAIVVTFVSTGVLNFAFGSIAYFIARFYYFLNTQHGWAILPAALVTICVAGPAMGVLLWAVLFRYLRTAPQLIRIVATIGLTVCLPPIAAMIFGNEQISTVSGLAPQPEHVYMVFGTAVTLDQIFVYAAVVIMLVLGAIVLRWTDAGLKVRALVDSAAMTDLSGTSPLRVEIAIWTVSTFLAGVIGVMSAPIIGLVPADFSIIIAAAFAAVVAARLRSIPVAVGVGLLMGLAGSMIQRYLPPQSEFTAAIVPAIPGIFIVVFLLIYLLRRGQVTVNAATGGPLDEAIRPHGLGFAAGTRAATTSRTRQVAACAVVAMVAVAILFSNAFWVAQLGLGVVYALTFLSFSLVTGEGGMIWLCQITFAGFGAIVTGQAAVEAHVPVLLAVLLGGIVAGAVGMVLAMLTVRLGDLYVALVTLTFGLLIENLVFIVNRWYQDGVGVSVGRPSFALSDRGFAYLALVAFCVIALVVTTMRRSTSGLALAAIRGSETGAKTLGLNIVLAKVFVAGAAATVAGIGGGFLALYSGAAVPTNFGTFLGLTWLAVLVTNGVRSNVAALFAGLAFSLIPALFLTYLSSGWQNVLPALFGLGAIMVVRNPDGVVVQNARQLESFVAGRVRRRDLVTAGTSG
jgi:branched-chain amino acid transport system permease protein